VVKRSTVAYLFPEDHEALVSAARAYQNGGEKWQNIEPELRKAWREKLLERRGGCQSALDKHDRLYPDWEHEKEASAFAELVSRLVQATSKNRWGDIQYDMDNLKNYDPDKKSKN
jgi:hypothetical protein